MNRRRLEQQLKILELALVTDRESMGQVGFCWLLLLLEHVPLNMSHSTAILLEEPFSNPAFPDSFSGSPFLLLWVGTRPGSVALGGLTNLGVPFLSPTPCHRAHRSTGTLAPSFTCPALWDILASSGNKQKEQFILIPELYVMAELLVSQVKADFCASASQAC